MSSPDRTPSSGSEEARSPAKRGQQQEEEEGDNDGGQKREAVGFWDPGLSNVRKKAISKWAAMTLFLSCMILSLLSLYWGALRRVNKNLPSLTVLVVDFDSKIAPYTSSTPIVGPVVTKAAQMQNISPMPHLGFIVKEPADYNNDPMEVRRAIYHQHHWVGIIVNPNATALLEDAVSQGNSSYDPNGVGQIIYVEARDQSTIDEYMLPLINELTVQVTAQFGMMWAQQVTSRMSNDTIRGNIRSTPQALNPAIGFTTYNLRPFQPPVATPAVTIGLIYLIIFSFFSFSFFLPIHMELILPNGHKPLKFNQWILWRIVMTIAAYFFFSLFYSLTSLAFHVPFSRGRGPETEVASSSRYGHGSFVVYWMLNWVGTTALGLPCENVAMIVGPPWFALWLIFWVISNVCTAFYTIPIEPGFFSYGYAWPIHNVVEASRTIIFDTHSRIGLNFGVLFAWIGISLALFPFCAHFARWKMMQEKEKKKKESKQEKEQDEKREDVERANGELGTAR